MLRTRSDIAPRRLTVSISTRGQVILPKAMRDQLGRQAGTRLAVERTADGMVLKLLTEVFPPTRPEDVFGCLPYAGKPKTMAKMDAGITAEARRRHARD